MPPKPSLHGLFARGLVIARAYAAAGIHEQGGNNRGDEVEFFLRMAGAVAGEAWCCAFVFTCLCKAYAQLTGQMEDRASLLALAARMFGLTGIPRTAGCAEMWTALQHLGITRGPHADIGAGALVFYDFKGQGEPHHIGFVSSASPADRILGTVEGNTPEGAGGNQADGDGVLAKSRSRSLVFGFAAP